MEKIKFYALSTCIWCRKTKQYLDELEVAYEHILVDLLSQTEKDKALKELEKYNSQRVFPTLVFKGNKVVVGYKPEDIRAALNK